ncbi:MAG TPA: enoyl-ACP reductase [Dictyoglomaceae bacterium]|nr:enoyl-ACP reductase [Dictyoglomaceae bacterium]HOL39435.1 enoyl-ACP reductase [Dictyoglomaceae bacterium]HPP16372.1 enoyl-ACP reductase [Dictyoglomaceae bacterium]HPU43494.1 enoyl-ACP reductase [Dictyoglomaceae bacterium]
MLEGKKFAVFNVANKKSIAWAIAQSITKLGGEVIIGYQNERLRENVEELITELPKKPFIVECDASEDENIEKVAEEIEKNVGKIDGFVHSIAYAPSDALKNPFIQTTKDAFLTTMDISVYSFVAMTRIFKRILNTPASIVTLTYYGSEKVIPNYNVMGVAKAALEASIRYSAYELGGENIRVNAISAGPLSTLAARGISRFTDMLSYHKERAPLQRNIEYREVGDTAAFLLSELSSGITGEIIYVDAGYNIIGM